MSRTAIYIDGENISSNHIDKILETCRKMGDISLKKIYGDLNCSVMAPWIRVASQFGFQLIHCNRTQNNKNTTDLQLAIDVTEDSVFHDEICNIVLVSSDADFTPVVHKLLNHGKTVVGIGCHKTNNTYANCHSKFVLLPNNSTASKSKTKTKTKTKTKIKAKFQFKQFTSLDLAKLCFPLFKVNSWVDCNSIGQFLSKKYNIKPGSKIKQRLLSTGYFTENQNSLCNPPHLLTIKSDSYEKLEGLCQPCEAKQNLKAAPTGNNVVQLERHKKHTDFKSILAFEYRDISSEIMTKCLLNSNFRQLVLDIVDVYKNADGWIPTTLLARSMQKYLALRFNNESFSIRSFFSGHGYREFKTFIEQLDYLELMRTGKQILIREKCNSSEEIQKKAQA